jgi:hypothetical protein
MAAGVTIQRSRARQPPRSAAVQNRAAYSVAKTPANTSSAMRKRVSRPAATAGSVSSIARVTEARMAAASRRLSQERPRGRLAGSSWRCSRCRSEVLVSDKRPSSPSGSV